MMRKYYFAAALIALFAIGSYVLYYAVSKDKIADQTTLEDLQTLHDKIRIYTQEKNKLPASLSELDLTQRKVAARLDRYTYTPQPRYSGNDYTYEICANFKTEKPDPDYGYGSDTYISTSSGHKQGRDCFTLKVYGY
jgi:hypothetical protein